MTKGGAGRKGGERKGYIVDAGYSSDCRERIGVA